MTIAVIVQARLGSKRFPNKVLAQLAGKPVLQHVLERCKEIKGVDVVDCAIPRRDAKALEELILEWGSCVWVQAGDENDVLTRYLGAARFVDASVIMRITGDCPLIDPDVCGEVLAKFQEGGYDYVSNVYPRTWPKGLDCEVFSREVLEWADQYADDPYDREHVTSILPRRSIDDAGGLSIFNVQASYDASHVNYCVDYPEDIERLELVLRQQDYVEAVVKLGKYWKPL